MTTPQERRQHIQSAIASARSLIYDAEQLMDTDEPDYPKVASLMRDAASAANRAFLKSLEK